MHLLAFCFLSGWLSPIPALPDGVFLDDFENGIFLFYFAMIKAITPRYRYDQLMRLWLESVFAIFPFWVVLVAFLAKFEVFGSLYARYLVGG